MPEKIDKNIYASIQELMGDKFVLMIEKYTESTAEYLSNIQTGMSEDDAEKVQNAAHPFKSSSASLGFIAVSEAAKKIERDAEEASKSGAALDSLQDDCKKLETEYADVIAFLEAQDL